MDLSKLATGIPIVGGLFDNTDQEAMDALKQNQALWNSVKPKTLDKYNPESYSYAGDLDPTLAQANTISTDPNDRSTQLAVLNKMAGLADNGLSDVDQAGYMKAREMGDQMARSGEEAAEANAAARGVLGSGNELSMRDQASQAGAQRAQDAALQQAADSARQRALYTQALGGMAGQVRGQDFSQSAANADILNRFNQMNTQTQNQAQERNLGARQNISNANTATKNQAQQYNIGNEQLNNQNQMQWAGGMSGANRGVANGYAAQNAANTDQRNSNTDLMEQILGIGNSSNKKQQQPGGGGIDPSTAWAGADSGAGAMMLT